MFGLHAARVSARPRCCCGTVCAMPPRLHCPCSACRSGFSSAVCLWSNAFSGGLVWVFTRSRLLPAPISRQCWASPSSSGSYTSWPTRSSKSGSRWPIPGSTSESPHSGAYCRGDGCLGRVDCADGEAEGYGCPPGLDIFRPKPSAVRLDNRAADCQAHSHSVRLGRVERLENPFRIAKPVAAISHFDLDCSVILTPRRDSQA